MSLNLSIRKKTTFFSYFIVKILLWIYTNKIRLKFVNYLKKRYKIEQQLILIKDV